MKTAVEWYCNEMESLRVDSEIGNMKAHEFLIRRADIFHKAKEMEKEQIKDAYNHGKFNSVTMGTSEQYYNETFKSE
jgi:hypothetical protein